MKSSVSIPKPTALSKLIVKHHSPDFHFFHAALKEMLKELTPKYIEIVISEKDRSLAMTALHCIQEMLDSIGEPVLAVSDDTFTSIVSAVKDVLRGKVSNVSKTFPYM